MADLDSPDPFAPPSYGWSPEQEQLFADAMAQAAAQQPAPGEIEMPADNFASVTPAELDAARQAQGGEIEMPADNFASVSPAELEAVRQEQAPPPPLPVGAWDPAVTAAPEMPAPPAPPAPPQALGATLPGVGVPLSLVPADPRTPAQRDLEVPVDAELEEAQRFERLSPEEQAREIQAYEDQRASRLRAAEAARDEERARDAERSRDNAIKARLAARQELQQINEEAQRLAQTEIDPDRYRKNRSAVSTILDVIAAAAGGLTQHLNGGRNLGLEMLERAIDRDIEAQKLNRAGQRAELERRSGVALEKMRLDEQDAREDALYRMTIYEAAERRAARDQAELDQRGTSHFRLAQIRQGIAARKQEALLGLEKARAEQIKNALDAEGKLLDLEKKRAELLLAQKKATGYGMGGGGVRKPDDVLQPPEYFAQLGLVPPPNPMTPEAHRAWLKDRKSSNEVISSDPTSGRSKEELERLFKLPSGEEFVARGPIENVAKVQRKVAATKSLVRAMDEVLRIRTGWTSDTAKSDEWQKAKANWALAFGIAKDVLGLGALSGADFDLVGNFVGSKDPTSFRDPTAGILRARQNVLNMVGDELEGLGMRGKFEIPRPTLSPVVDSPSDREFKAALTSPSPGDVVKAAQDGRRVVAPGREYDEELVVLPGVQRTIESLRLTAKSGSDKDRADARQKLQQLYTDGPNEGVRNAAEAALLDIVRPADVEGPQQATARDSISQPVRR